MPAVNDYKWELYNLDKDFSQANDLAAQMPVKLLEMKGLFWVRAKKYNVFPLDNSQLAGEQFHNSRTDDSTPMS